MADNYDFVINCTDGVCDPNEHDYNGYLERLQAKESSLKELVHEAKAIFDETKDTVKDYARFVMTLNHLLWHHYNKGEEQIARLYDELWHQADGFAYRRFKGKELDWYVRFLD